MIEPPDEGCEAAVRCGRDFAQLGMSLDKLPKALTFCDSEEEKSWFLVGVVMERLDL